MVHEPSEVHEAIAGPAKCTVFHDEGPPAGSVDSTVLTPSLATQNEVVGHPSSDSDRGPGAGRFPRVPPVHVGVWAPESVDWPIHTLAPTIPPATHNCGEGQVMDITSTGTEVSCVRTHVLGPPVGESDTYTAPPLVTAAQKFAVEHDTAEKLSSVGAVSTVAQEPLSGAVEA